MKIISVVFAVLSAGALAAPATNETEHISALEKRGHYGWVSSYAPDDAGCKGKWGGQRPKINGQKCAKFSPISDNIGVWWGSVSIHRFHTSGKLDIEAEC